MTPTDTDTVITAASQLPDIPGFLWPPLLMLAVFGMMAMTRIFK